MNAPPASRGVPAFVLVSGPERVLADRALTATIEAVRSVDADADVVRLHPQGYEEGSLAVHASPSLFGGSTVIVVRDLDEATDTLLQEVLAYMAAPADHVVLIVMHKGGNRGKKIVDILKATNARVLPAPAIRTDRDKNEFVLDEFRRMGRKIRPEGVRALVEAVGRDVSELAAACAQLVADTTGEVGEHVVEIYYGGKVEASGFRVADAALRGHPAEALRLLRHAIAGGTDPVPIVAVLAAQVRQLAKVADAGSGPSGRLASSLGMAPWQVDKARRLLAGWDDTSLGYAIQAIAAADWEVKGGARDPVYAVERAILNMAHGRTRRD